MNKGLLLGVMAVLNIALLASCNRRHDCYCTYGSNVDPLHREYRGYTREEARKLCKSEENGSSPSQPVNCDLR